MKITAEFNSNEELLSFIGAFGAKGLTTLAAGAGNDLSQVKTDSTAVKETSKGETKNAKKDVPKGESKNPMVHDVLKESGTPSMADKKEEVSKNNTAPKDKPKENKETAKEGSKPEEETQITKEMIRAKFMELIQKGKSKEAREITEKYGAKRLPDLKEEDYPAVHKEVEALL